MAEFQFFREEAYLKLEKKLLAGTDPDSRDDLETLGDILLSLHAYVETVVRKEIGVRLYVRRMEGTAYQEAMQDYDRERHNRHETAITNTKLMNRLAEIYGCGPVFAGDDQERHQVAAFCMEFCQFMFSHRTMKLS